MKKLMLIGLAMLALAFSAFSAMQANAAPKNASLLTLDCGEAGAVEVLVQLNSSSVAVFDPSGDGGRTYLVQSLEVRAYAGELTEEPVEDPVFSFGKQYGNRTGFLETLECTGSFIEPVTPEGPATIFFDVALVAK